MSVKYACTALIGTNKSGILKPDEFGYYKVILGALNYHNAMGIFYDLDSSKAVFDQSSSFMRRISAGNLYCEVEHPKWEKGMSLDDYVRRIRHVEGQNTCAHIREIELEMGKTGASGKPVCIIYGWVKPDRIHGHLLKAALDNPKQNVCFSIRSLVNERNVRGEIQRTITELITFDWVTEPGINLANKFNAPGLESYVVHEETAIQVPIAVLEGIAKSYRQMRASGIALESDDANSIDETLQRIKQIDKLGSRPAVLTSW